MQARKANIERIEEAVEGAQYENMQYLISEAKWEHALVLDKVAQEASRLIGDPKDACLIIDESYFQKKGSFSAGVARQWNGRLGKVENSQVGVFISLANGNRVCPIACQLYLPEEWTEDSARLIKAKVPQEHQDFRTKHDLALEMIDQCIQNDVRFGWVGADGLYGHSIKFLRELEQRNLTYVMDLHCSDHVYISDPDPFQPEKKGPRGRSPNWRTDKSSFRVDTWIKDTPDKTWERVYVRNTTAGELWLEALQCPVWRFDEKTGKVSHLTLVITRDPNNKGDVKYTISNASSETSLQRLVYMVAQRYWVERSFQESKENSGMAEYQVRGWLGWHRHMTLVMMTQLFMLGLKVEHAEDIKMLSCSDIKEVLAACLPNRRLTPGEAARQLRARHERRRSSTQSRYKARGQPVPEPWQ